MPSWSLSVMLSVEVFDFLFCRGRFFKLSPFEYCVLTSEVGLFLTCIHLFIGRPGSLLPRAGFLSRCGARGATLYSRGAGFSWWWLLALRSTALRRVSSCSWRARRLSLPGAMVWRTSSVASWRVGSSHSRDRTCVPALAGGLLTAGLPGKPHR